MTFHMYSFNWSMPDISTRAFAISSEGLRNLTISISDTRTEPYQGYSRVEIEAGWRCLLCMGPHELAMREMVTRTEGVSAQELECLSQWAKYYRHAGLDLVRRNNSNKVQLSPYRGSSGYPFCEDCKVIPGYEYLAIPAINRTVESYDICIPVLGVGVVANVHGFLQRMVRSIDACVHNFVLVQSSTVNVTVEIELLKSNKFIHNVTVVLKDSPIMAVADSWNSIVRVVPTAPWVAFVAYDVYFIPGQLIKFAESFWAEKKVWETSERGNIEYLPTCVEEGGDDSGREKLVVKLMAFTGWVNMNKNGRYNFFAVDAKLLEAAGSFDENFFPAFIEDMEWSYRISLLSEVHVVTFFHVIFYHGKDDYNPNIKYKVDHRTYTSGTEYVAEGITKYIGLRDEGKHLNKIYIQRKWGCDRKLWGCTYKHPFNNNSLPISYWERDDRKVEALLVKYGYALPVHNSTSQQQKRWRLR